jgi:hypothetical protein
MYCSTVLYCTVRVGKAESLDWKRSEKKYVYITGIIIIIIITLLLLLLLSPLNFYFLIRYYTNIVNLISNSLNSMLLYLICKPFYQ